MATWREHELNFLPQGQPCEIVVDGRGRQHAFWDATFRFFWIELPEKEVITLDKVQEWRPV